MALALDTVFRYDSLLIRLLDVLQTHYCPDEARVCSRKEISQAWPSVEAEFFLAVARCKGYPSTSGWAGSDRIIHQTLGI